MAEPSPHCGLAAPVACPKAVLASQVERCTEIVLEHFGEHCVVCCLLPWTREVRPYGLLAPGTVDAELCDREIAHACSSRHTVLVPCTFEAAEEEASAHRILPQFSVCSHVCVFMVQLLPDGMEPTRATNDLIMKRHGAMLATGVDDVFFDMALAPNALRQTINVARASWELNVRRMQLMLDAEPDLVSPEEMRATQVQHQRMLWESIPKALMPHFKPLDTNLPESGTRVGEYRLVRKLDTVSGTVLFALDKESSPVVIKVIDKVKVFTPGELEGIYREYRFLSEIIKHPNVVRCLCMMHSLARVYLVFEAAGDQNLAQRLSDCPGNRLGEDEALACFDQIAAGVAHCHASEVCHRSLSLTHVVVSRAAHGDGAFHYRLVDFHCAMSSRGPTTSRTICGTLPCIAPEMALGGPYTPRFADCWSCGVMLLESAGGLTSLCRAVPYPPSQANPQPVAQLICNYFAAVGSHRRALALLGAVHSGAVLLRLEALLCPIPERRAPLAELLRSKPAAPRPFQHQ